MWTSWTSSTYDQGRQRLLQSAGSAYVKTNNQQVNSSFSRIFHHVVPKRTRIRQKIWIHVKEVAGLYRDCVNQNASFGYKRLAGYIWLDMHWCVLRILTTTSVILGILHLFHVLYTRSKRRLKYHLPESLFASQVCKRAFWAITVS